MVSVAKTAINIPPASLLKIILRGINNLSFIDEVIKESSSMIFGERRGLRTQDGIIVYFEKGNNQVTIVSAYLIGREHDILTERIKALFGYLIQIVSH
jgi:hypothetical protein